jgi:serine/threonine protein kinase
MTGKVTSFGADRSVVIKKASQVAEFTREVEMLKRLQGDGCRASQLYDENTTSLYFVMESFGKRLNDFFPTRATTECRLTIALQMIGALRWLHEKDIAHCDLKPKNLLVLDLKGGRFEAKLCDFESATEVGDEFPHGVHHSKHVLRFTTHWVSPEVYLHNRLVQTNATNSTTAKLFVSKAMDVFPMGLVLGCLFEKEGSVNMTMLPDDDDQIRTTLTEPELLLDRISCNSLPSCREHIRSLCRLEPACRGRLSDVSAALEALTRSGLQSLNDVRVIDDMQMQVTQVNTVAAKLQDDVRESHDETQSVLKSIISNLSRPRGDSGVDNKFPVG